jgi:hypothetical protein
MSAMAKDPAHRPATMEQYAEMLASVLASLPPDPAYQASAAMSAMSPAVVPKSAIQTAQPRYDTPPAAYAPPQPTPPPYQQQVTPPQPYQPGYAAPPYQPPAIPPTVGVQHAPRSRSKLPLFLLLGALALGGAGVGVWAATRTSSPPKEDDHQLHVDHDSSDDQPEHPDNKPDKSDHDLDVPIDPPNNGTDPWANNNGSSPPQAPQAPHAPQQPHRPGKHDYTCDQVAAHAMQVFAQELQKQLTSMTPEQLQAMAPQLQQLQGQVTTMYKNMVDQCNASDMKDSARKCAMDATSFADIAKCQ